MKKALILIFITFLAGFVLMMAEQKKISEKEQAAIEKIERFIEVNSTAKVKVAFEKFMKGLKIPVGPEGLKDGEYIGDSVYDNYKYKHSVKITIKNGKIVKVFYNEVKKDGHGKREDKKYCAEMKKGTGISPAEAYPLYEKKLLQQQDIIKVDALTGATYSLYRFRTALIRAFLKAKK